MKNLFQRAIMFLAQSEVIAHFLNPSAGLTAAYKEGDFIGQSGAMANAELGKQIIINAGNGNSQILAFDSDPLWASAQPTRARNQKWFAPDKNWLDTVTETTDIDFDNSNLVYGTGQTVILPTLTGLPMPFKRDGNKIVFDASLPGAVITPTNVEGITKPGPSIPGGNITPTPGKVEPTTGNASKGFFANLAWWGYAIIAIVAGGVIYLIVKAVGGAKKVVKK